MSCYYTILAATTLAKSQPTVKASYFLRDKQFCYNVMTTVLFSPDLSRYITENHFAGSSWCSGLGGHHYSFRMLCSDCCDGHRALYDWCQCECPVDASSHCCSVCSQRFVPQLPGRWDLLKMFLLHRSKATLGIHFQWACAASQTLHLWCRSILTLRCICPSEHADRRQIVWFVRAMCFSWQFCCKHAPLLQYMAYYPHLLVRNIPSSCAHTMVGVEGAKDKQMFCTEQTLIVFSVQGFSCL